jgi:ATP-dependent DNA helicase RecG
MTLDTPVDRLPTVRTRVAEGLARLGIRTVRQLLFHFPSRHEDRRTVTPIRDIVPGMPIVIRGRVQSIALEDGFRRRGGRARRVPITRAVVADASGNLAATWFHQRYLAAQYEAGTDVILTGTVSLGETGLTIVAPEIERVLPGKTLLHAGRLVPVYPETAGVTSRLLRFLISRVLPLAAGLREYLPEPTRGEEELLPITDAVRSIHFPETDAELTAARERLSFDELFLLQVAALHRKRTRIGREAVSVVATDTAVEQLTHALPFQLTASQSAAVAAIRADLHAVHPMNRLLAGDVGSGKTVIAGIAAALVAQAGGQSILAAPTEILAEQHAETLQTLFRGAGLRVGILTGASTPLEREALLARVSRGEIDLLVGTHALFYADVSFHSLALVIVDEQHRFGVEQRAEFTTRDGAAITPHFLSLSATPIPRTLQLTAYGDVDVSLLDARPGQQTVRTEVVSPTARNTMYASLANATRAGGQVFVVCPRVEERDDEVRSVRAEYERLRTDVFKDFRVGMLHGTLPAEEKTAVLRQFRDHALDVLVASSVIEVGVDIPAATALLIEGAERFGLAQLHQLRGRVGRRGQDAICYLATTEGSAVALDRLRVLERTHDGLTIAEEDLRRRGAGEIYGTRQSGGVRLKIANIADVPFLLRVRQAAERLLQRDAPLDSAPLLRKRVAQLNVTTHFE